MKKSLLLALAFVVPSIPGPAATLPRLRDLKTIAGLGAVPPAAAPAAIPGKALARPRASVAAAADRAQPDWSFTPGRLCTDSDPDFVEYRYPEHIPYCKRHVTQQMKEQVAAHYGIPKSDWGSYEFDHLIPLAIGGDSHVDNLWPQPHGAPDGSDGKDVLENQLYQEMKAGTVTQAEAIKEIYAWFGAQNALSSPMPTGR